MVHCGVSWVPVTAPSVYSPGPVSCLCDRIWRDWQGTPASHVAPYSHSEVCPVTGSRLKQSIWILLTPLCHKFKYCQHIHSFLLRKQSCFSVWVVFPIWYPIITNAGPIHIWGNKTWLSLCLLMPWHHQQAHCWLPKLLQLFFLSY